MLKYIVSQPAITLCIESTSSQSPITTHRTHVAQRLRAFVFISHHRTHRFALLQQQFGDGAPDAADASRGTCDQNASVPISRLPVGPHEMAGVTAGIPLEIILMLGLGLPEVASRNHFRNDLSGPQA